MSDKKYIDSENLLQWIGERITCEALCGNHIKSDKGCDGNCTLGEITPREKSIISVITESIKTAPAADVEPVVRCKDCIHCVPLDAHADGVYGMHCLYQRGEEVRNVWHKFKKYYKDYSIVEGNSFCDQGERGAHMERSGSGE